MEARAYLRNARISPRKVQIVLDLIRNKRSVRCRMLRYTRSYHEENYAESTGQSL